MLNRDDNELRFGHLKMTNVNDIFRAVSFLVTVYEFTKWVY